MKTSQRMTVNRDIFGLFRQITYDWWHIFETFTVTLPWYTNFGLIKWLDEEMKRVHSDHCSELLRMKKG